MTLTGKSMFMAKPHSSVKSDADDILVEDQDGTMVSRREFKKRMEGRIEVARRAKENTARLEEEAEKTEKARLKAEEEQTKAQNDAKQRQDEELRIAQLSEKVRREATNRGN